MLFVLLLVLLGSAGPTAARLAGPPAPAAPVVSPTVPGCGMQGAVVPSPNIGTDENLLSSIAVAGPGDLWAVGSYYDAVSGYYQGLILHGDGTTWTVVPSPAPGASANFLDGVTALAPDDVWAVGRYATSGSAYTLILHWDGAAWAVVPSPNSSSSFNLLAQVAAGGPNDVWAVGTADIGGVAVTLTEHWDGTAWTIVPSPNGPTGSSRLLSVAAAGPDDVWAAGHTIVSTYVYQTLIEHWDGTAWTVVPAPNPGSSAMLTEVELAGPGDGWVVGSTTDSSGTVRTLTMHWDGTAWTVVPSPNASTTSNGLLGLAVGAADDVWAVGDAIVGPSEQPLALHWDGTAWAVLPTPAPALGSGILNGVALSGAHTVWAVGEGSRGPQFQTLTVQYSDPCGGPTPTPIPPAFSDVPPSDTFYAAISYVAGQGVMQGYPDGTFRPGNLTTRGQMSKIIVLGFGLALQTPVAGASFEDVPRGDTFFPYVETVAARGIARGYRCGGVNPQTGAGLLCVAPQERPYFLPGNFVTRGQLAKQVVLAASQVAGWALLNPPSGHFSDVPPTHAFYPYVETAVAHGVIGGYSDQTFRPANTATRAQSAVVLYRARAGTTVGPSPSR
jgi:hypothetical protein